MLSWVCAEEEPSVQATRCLVDGGGNAALFDASDASSATDADNSPSRHWLLRLGGRPQKARSASSRRGLGPWSGVTRSRGIRARHAIQSWRLRRPYFLYCLGCSLVTAFLLCWNIVKGSQNDWNLPQWKHHPWEEALEVGIGVLMVIETVITMRLLGLRAFLRSCWCLLDLCIALLTTVSVGYGLEHLGRRGEICEADVPLLLLRFALQPTRVCVAFIGAYRTRRIQAHVDECCVDFDALPTASGGDGAAGTGPGAGTTPFEAFEVELG